MARNCPCRSEEATYAKRLALREDLHPRYHPRRGEIWEVDTPGQPEDPHQPRPALIISEDERNRLADDFLVVPIFSGGSGPTRVLLPAGEGGIEHDSVIYCEEVTCLYEDFLVRGPLGEPVHPRILRRVVEGVRITITPIGE